MKRPPDSFGISGRAWRIDMDKLRKVYKSKPDQDAGVATWILDVPISHPIWWWYQLSLIHLRGVPGIPGDPIIYLPGATHEFFLEAIDPRDYPPDPENKITHMLRPMNFAAQMICSSDEDAIKRIETQAILPIVHGMLSPDTDHTRRWIEIFGNSMIKKYDWVLDEKS